MAFTEATIMQYQHPRIKLVVGGTSTTAASNPVTIYEPDIVSGSFSYKTGTSSGGAFAPGGCVTSSCAFTVKNKSGEYTNLFAEDTKVKIYVGYGATPQSATYEILGIVYVSDARKRNHAVQVQAFDRLRKADKKRWTTYYFPMTLNTIIGNAAAQAGISNVTLPTAGGSTSIDLRDEGGNQPELNMTCRQALSSALEISGNFARIVVDSNETESLQCGWYPRTADASITASWLRDYTVKSNRAYTGVQVYGQAISGTADRLFVLSSNPFLTESNAATVQSRLYSALVGRPVCEANIRSVWNPSIQPGQLLSLTYPQAGGTQTLLTPITSVSIGGGMTATLSSEDIQADEADDLRETPAEEAQDAARDAMAYASSLKSEAHMIRIGEITKSYTWQEGVWEPMWYCMDSNLAFQAWHPPMDGFSATYGYKIPAQDILIPSKEAVAAYAAAHSINLTDMWFPITLYVGICNFWGYVTLKARWSSVNGIINQNAIDIVGQLSLSSLTPGTSGLPGYNEPWGCCIKHSGQFPYRLLQRNNQDLWNLTQST